jgi:hypothetical protein
LNRSTETINVCIVEIYLYFKKNQKYFQPLVCWPADASSDIKSLCFTGISSDLPPEKRYLTQSGLKEEGKRHHLMTSAIAEEGKHFLE